MKIIILVSVIMAVMFLTWGSVAPAHAQDSAKDDKPTFYHLVPGTYVNGWPRFTVTYPKEWTAERPDVAAGQVFLVSPPGPGPYPTMWCHGHCISSPFGQVPRNQPRSL